MIQYTKRTLLKSAVQPWDDQTLKVFSKDETDVWFQISGLKVRVWGCNLGIICVELGQLLCEEEVRVFRGVVFRRPHSDSFKVKMLAFQYKPISFRAAKRPNVFVQMG